MSKDTEKASKDELVLEKDTLFSSAIRMSIMMILCTYKSVPFVEFQNLLNISSGSLDHHLRMLEKKEYVTRDTKIFPQRPLVVASITSKGKQKFNNYIRSLKSVLNKI